VSTHVTHDRPHLYDRLVSDHDGRLLPYVVTWVGADDPVDQRQVAKDSAQALDLSSSCGDRVFLTRLDRTAARPAGWYVGGPSGTRVRFLALVPGAGAPDAPAVGSSPDPVVGWTPQLRRSDLGPGHDTDVWHALTAVPGDEDQTAVCGWPVDPEAGLWDNVPQLPGNTACAACAAGTSAEPTPELHEGTEQQGLGRVQVRCSCAWASGWQPLGTTRKTSVRNVWAEHSEHAVSALREAVRTAHALYVAGG